MSDSAHILVVDDEPAICELLEHYLVQQGYRISTAKDGEGLRRTVARSSVDLVIVDLGLPGEDGLSLTRYLREQWNVGVIILTGRGDTVDRTIGLEVGADDYVAKPFDLRELLARVRSVLRRVRHRPHRGGESNGAAAPMCFAGWQFDRASRRLVSPEGKEVPLTAGEFDLLCVFVDHPNRVLSRDELLDLTHQREAGPFDRSVDVQVGRLRRKIEADAAQPVLIKTVRNAGYVFTASVERVPGSPD